MLHPSDVVRAKNAWLDYTVIILLVNSCNSRKLWFQIDGCCRFVGSWMACLKHSVSVAQNPSTATLCTSYLWELLAYHLRYNKAHLSDLWRPAWENPAQMMRWSLQCLTASLKALLTRCVLNLRTALCTFIFPLPILMLWWNSIFFLETAAW